MGLALMLPAAAQATEYVYLPEGVTALESAAPEGGFVKLSNGEYELEAPHKAGYYQRYSAPERETIHRRYVAVATKPNPTLGIEPGSILGVTGPDKEAANKMWEDLNKAEDTAQADKILEEVETTGRTIGDLPTAAEVAGGVGTVAEVGGAAVVGIGIGTGIDELVGLPTPLNLLEGSPEYKLEPGCWFTGTTKCSVKWWQTRKEYEGTSYPCNHVKVAYETFDNLGPASETCLPFDVEGKAVGHYTSGGVESSESHTWNRSKRFAESETDSFNVKAGVYDGGCVTHAGYSGSCFNVTASSELALMGPTKEPANTGVSGSAGSVTLPKPSTPITPPNEFPGPAETEVAGDSPEEGKEHIKVPLPTEPELPLPSTTEPAKEYAEKLEKDGWKHVHESVRSEATENPHVGPNDVAGVHPEAGSRVAYSHEVQVEANPSNAPFPAESHGPGGSPTLPGFNIPSFAPACHSFPFGAPCWALATIEKWDAEAEAPSAVIPVNKKGVHLSLASVEPMMEVIRPILVVCVSILIIAGFAAKAWSGHWKVGEQGELFDGDKL